MHVTLTDEIKSFVQEKVASGAYPSAEAVLREALRRLRQEDEAAVYARRRENAAIEDLIDYEAIAS